MKAGPIISILINTTISTAGQIGKMKHVYEEVMKKQFLDESFFSSHPKNALIKTLLVAFYRPLMNIQVE